MKVAIAQINIVPGDRERNLKKSIKIIKKIDADVIIFPELFTTGFYYKNLDVENFNDTIKKLSNNCNNKIVIGTIIEKEGNHYYNTMLVISNKGLIEKYRKIHLFFRERKYFRNGNELKVFKYENFVIGLAICYDIRFPEMFRKLLKMGANTFIISAAFPLKRKDHWEILLKARAIENQAYVIACNRIGRDLDEDYAGTSMIIDPWGNVLKKASDDKEEILYENLKYERILEIRNNFPILKDIKLY